jgi:hypothetical protein
MSPNPEDRQGYLEELAASLEQGRRLIQGRVQHGQFPILMRAEGVNALVLLMEDRVRIQQKEEKTFPDQAARGVRDIPLSRISMVRIKRPSNFGNGFMRFVLIGGDAKVRDPESDENTVAFRGANEPEFERLKAAIEAKLAGKSSVPYTPPSRGVPVYIEELQQLAALRDRGILTEDEFAAKKRQILGL